MTRDILERNFNTHVTLINFVALQFPGSARTLSLIEVCRETTSKYLCLVTISSYLRLQYSFDTSKLRIHGRRQYFQLTSLILFRTTLSLKISHHQITLELVRTLLLPAPVSRYVIYIRFHHSGKILSPFHDSIFLNVSTEDICPWIFCFPFWLLPFTSFFVHSTVHITPCEPCELTGHWHSLSLYASHFFRLIIFYRLCFFRSFLMSSSTFPTSTLSWHLVAYVSVA